MTGRWICGVAIEAMPVTVVPDDARAVSWRVPLPDRPLTCDRVQFAPSAAVQTVPSGWPGAPVWTAATKPPGLAVSAVTAGSGPSAPNGTCRQVAPPSVDSSASGLVTPAAVCTPRATTRLPSIAICWSTPVAPCGSGRTIVFQAGPLVVVHNAGWPSCDPAEMNPCALAATASTWLEPVASFTSCARVQLAMFGDHQTSATQEPPGATSLPTMT